MVVEEPKLRAQLFLYSEVVSGTGEERSEREGGAAFGVVNDTIGVTSVSSRIVWSSLGHLWISPATSLFCVAIDVLDYKTPGFSHI